MSRVTAGMLQQLRCWLPSCTRMTEAARETTITTVVITARCEISWRGTTATSRSRLASVAATAERCQISLLLPLLFLSLATAVVSPATGSSNYTSGSVDRSSSAVSTNSTGSSSSAYISGTELQWELRRKQPHQHNQPLLLQQQCRSLLQQQQKRVPDQQQQPQAFPQQEHRMPDRVQQSADTDADGRGQASRFSAGKEFSRLGFPADRTSNDEFAAATGASASGRETVTAAGSSAVEERDRGTPKSNSYVLRRRAATRWAPEKAATGGADVFNFIQLSSFSSSKDQEDIRVLQRPQHQLQETGNEKEIHQQSIRPHAFTPAATKETATPLREAPIAFAAEGELLSAKQEGRKHSPHVTPTEASLLLAVQQTFSATEGAAEAAAAEQHRLEKEASFLGTVPGKSLIKDPPATIPKKTHSSRIQAAARQSSLKDVSPTHASSSSEQQKQQPLAYSMPLSHLQELVQQALSKAEDEGNGEDQEEFETEEATEAEAGAAEEEEEKGGQGAAAAAKEVAEKKKGDKAAGEEKATESSVEERKKTGAEEESAKTSVETTEKSSTSSREEEEEESAAGPVQESGKETGAPKAEGSTKDGGERKKEEKEGRAEPEAEEGREKKKREAAGGPVICTEIEDPVKCIAEPNCFHDEVYHQCFFNCTMLATPDDCRAHVSCRYEELLPRNACVNEGYQSTSISVQSFEGIIRGCEEFRTKEACELMAAANARLQKKGVSVLYNCQWLESPPPVSAHPGGLLQLQGRNEAATQAAVQENAAAASEGHKGIKDKANGEKGGGGMEWVRLPPAVGAASLCVNMAEVPTSEGLAVGSILAQKQKDLRELEESRNVSADKVCPFPEELAVTAKLEPVRPFYVVGETIEVECLPGHMLVGARRVITCEGKAAFSPRVDCISERNLSAQQLQYMNTIEKYANFTSDHPDIVEAAAAEAAAAAAKAARSSAVAIPCPAGITALGLALSVLGACCLT